MILAMVIILTGLLLIALFFLAKRSRKIMVVYIYLIKKMQYSALFRYVFQSTLKLHVAACTVIVYDRLTVKVITEPTSNV